jgi:phosphoserine aminotransferase
MNNTKKTFLTPGPTELLPEVKAFMQDALGSHICSINHRSGEFMELFKNTISELKKLMSIPESYHVFFLASATECMDRIIANCAGERTFHFVNGAFAERFYKTAVELEKRAEKIEAPYGESFNFSDINIYNEPELIAFTHNETSTGVTLPLEEIYKIKAAHSDSIIAVDIVTSAPYVNLDYNKIDCAFFSVQKGFALPAGLGVLILNDACLEKARILKEDNYNIGSYHNFLALYENAVKYQTTETPNVLDIYLLWRVCEYYNNYGIEKIRKETEEKAAMLYDFLDSSAALSAFVKDKNVRSRTVIVIRADDKQPELKQKLAEKGLIAGSGYGKFKESQIRIANFPVHTRENIGQVIKTLHAATSS